MFVCRTDVWFVSWCLFAFLCSLFSCLHSLFTILCSSPLTARRQRSCTMWVTSTSGQSAFTQQTTTSSARPAPTCESRWEIFVNPWLWKYIKSRRVLFHRKQGVTCISMQKVSFLGWKIRAVDVKVQRKWESTFLTENMYVLQGNLTCWQKHKFHIDLFVRFYNKCSAEVLKVKLESKTQQWPGYLRNWAELNWLWWQGCTLYITDCWQDSRVVRYTSLTVDKTLGLYTMHHWLLTRL